MNKDGILDFGYDTEIHGFVGTVRINKKKEVFARLIDSNDDIQAVDEWLSEIMKNFIDKDIVKESVINIVHEIISDAILKTMEDIVFSDEKPKTRFYYKVNLKEINEVANDYLEKEEYNE